MGDKYWKMEILVKDDVVRNYHELAPEDPETDQSLVSDWLSDLVIDAKAADEHAQDYPSPEVAAAREVQFARTRDGLVQSGNFLIVRAERVDYDNATDAATEPVRDEPGPAEDTTPAVPDRSRVVRDEGPECPHACS